MVRDYELMYIVRPDLDEEGLRMATESVGTLIHGLGGDVHKTSMWGKRRLAYEIDRLRDGHYVVLQLRLDGARVSELERALRIHDTVFRHLLVRREEEPAAGEDRERGETAADGATPERGETAAEGATPEPVASSAAETAGDDVEKDGGDEDEDEIPAAEAAEEDE
jgi:small subunit ribosomal protein S6